MTAATEAALSFSDCQPRDNKGPVFFGALREFLKVSRQDFDLTSSKAPVSFGNHHRIRTRQ